MGKKDYEKVKVGKTKRRYQIAVLGSSKKITTKKAYNFAYEVGVELAKAGCVTLTGGGLGVMEAALKGAKKHKGATLAIVPWENNKHVNDYADYVVATGIGWSRNSINLNSCDGAILVGGGVGTLNEASYGYMIKKPLVALTPSGGMAEELTNTYFDVRKTEYVFGAETAKGAVKLILKLIKEEGKKKNKDTEMDLLLKNMEENSNFVLLKNKRKKVTK